MISNPSQNNYDEIAAAKKLFQRRDDCIAGLSEISKEKVDAEVIDKIKKSDLKKLSNEELKRAIENQSDNIYYSEKYKQKIEEINWTLQSLTYLVDLKTKDEILAEIRPLDWSSQHQIITRWAWMFWQKELKMKDRNLIFNLLYLCKVGPLKGRRNLDREFCSLLNFLPSYRKQNQHEYLFHEKIDIPGNKRQPDFAVIDKVGNKMGVEVTEVRLDEEVYLEDEMKEEFDRVIQEKFHGLPWHITIKSRPSWRTMVKDIDEIMKWTESITEECLLKPLKKIYPENDLAISIEHSDYGFLIGDLSGSDGTGMSIDISSNTKKIIDMIYERIQKKLEPLKKPVINPCILVIYLDIFLTEIDLDKIKSTIKNWPTLDFKKHFDEIWLDHEQNSFRIL